ncbi:hypothetical protein KFK09_013136 [Dendrobium nobile]|uniref:FYVE-type domain-containing protein n=1 Tax=Dendrobium nobile TaxID=94219 RepID=A0A8T3B852_DENNO|nr:hypothetical protein KFK09_013136 [Dendrobium nobile]
MWVVDSLKNGPIERDVEQALTALKKGAYLLKYGRRGKPKFCPFKLSTDEISLIWYAGKDEKQLVLKSVSKIIPGQRTAIFKRFPRPNKEYQSFSLIYGDRSLDLICKDKDEAEVWFVGLKALISQGNRQNWRSESKNERSSTDTNSQSTDSRRDSPLIHPLVASDSLNKGSRGAKMNHMSFEDHSIIGLGKVFSDVILNSSSTKCSLNSNSFINSVGSFSSGAGDILNSQSSSADALRVSLSSGVSSSSHGSGHVDFDALGGVYIWGEGIGGGVLGGGTHRIGTLSEAKFDAFLPKALESAVVLDVHSISCGSHHAAIVTKHGELFSWGEESGGRLGHGVDADASYPKLIDSLNGVNIELVACGKFHSCAVTFSGDLYTWGDISYSCCLLGHGSVASHWIPKKIGGPLEDLHVSSVSCGPWHTAVVTSMGQLFTFGDGTFGALGHGDRRGTNAPREVEVLKGMRTVQAACGVWHTAAVVEILDDNSDSGSSLSCKIFTWGDADNGRLGHGDNEHRLIPACVTSLSEPNFRQVVCGNDITVALTSTGMIFTMGSTLFGQLGNVEADGNSPACVAGKICTSFVEEIACGSYHVAALTSKTEVYTWGKGANGRLGHGDNDDRVLPTLVEALKDKHVKSVQCGSNFTAVICLHKTVCGAYQAVCSGCHLTFCFRRKRHNCYNCGYVFCKACSSKKSVRASMAPNCNKPYRVCNDCYDKLRSTIGNGLGTRVTTRQNGMVYEMSNELVEKDAVDSKTQGQGYFSSLSSVQSFKGEGGHSKHDFKSRSNNGRVPPTLHENYEWGSAHSVSFSNLLCMSPKKVLSASLPNSRAATTSISTSSNWTYSSYLTVTPTLTDFASGSPEVMANNPKLTNDSLSQEVVTLKLKLEELTKKSQLLEAELESSRRQLKEATATAAEETSKCKAAKEVIKSLTVQLKDMVGTMPEEFKGENNYGYNISII